MLHVHSEQYIGVKSIFHIFTNFFPKASSIIIGMECAGSSDIQDFDTKPRFDKSLLECLKTFQSHQNLLRVCVNIKEYPETFPDCLETFHSVWDFSYFQKISKCLKTLHGASTLSKVSSNFSDCPETFKENYNFHITMQNISGLQKLSGKQCLAAWEIFLLCCKKVSHIFSELPKHTYTYRGQNVT